MPLENLFKLSSETESSSSSRQRISCSCYVNALWFCYLPVHQVQQYYRVGVLDNCSDKWRALVGCLSLNTKKSSEMQKIMDSHEKAKPHIWTMRTPEQAASNWKKLFGHLDR